MKQPTQKQIFYQVSREIGEKDDTFMQLVRSGLTREELGHLIERRPALWGRYASFLKTLPMPR